MRYVCATCGAPCVHNKNNGLGTWKCPNGHSKPSTSINQAGAFNKWADSTGREHVTAPVATGYRHAVVRVVR